jgi:uncharacterized protein YbjQ (UPF0145 family)
VSSSPSYAEMAIARLAEPIKGRSRRAASSDLSVDEAILLSEIGYEPRGLVMGSSIYHIGFQFTQWNQSAEVTQLTQAMYHARRAAMDRLEQQCIHLGAAGVVGVELEISMFEGSRHTAEFVATGTAVARTDAKVGRNEAYFSSDLSGKDFYLLRRAGYHPSGMVMGVCVYHVARQSLGRALSMSTSYQELTIPTEALYEARELAMERLQGEAEGLKAHGVVGVTTTERNHAWGSQTIEFSALGTAVRLVADEHQSLDPRMVVPLADARVATDPEAITG